VLALNALGGTYLQGPVAQVVLGLWRLSLPVLVTYALLRYQLFDLNVKLKWTINRGALATPFLAVFFIVTQATENFLNQFGILAGSVAAGLLLFALEPLQKVAVRLSDRAMPQTKALPQLSSDERLSLYREQVALAWHDGSLSRKERVMLDTLRERLGLSHAQAARLESQVTSAAPG
jgi:uncharacterized membrane protein YebE (DUF533 family)